MEHQYVRILMATNSRHFAREMHDILASGSETAQILILEVAKTPLAVFQRLADGDVDAFVIEIPPTAASEPDWIEGVRSFDASLPIVAVLTYEDGQAERRAIDAGADACLAVEELCEDSLLRAIYCAIERRQIGVLASREAASVEGCTLVRFGCFELDETKLVLSKRGKPIKIHLTPLRLLIYLVRNANRTVSKEELRETVWLAAAVSECAISSALKELRHALGDDGARQQWIETRRGCGYRFTGTASERGGEQSIKTVAVMPFEYLSNDCDANCFVAGMMDALIDEVSRVPRVHTIARASVMRCGALQQSVSEIAVTLGADAILTGTIARDGNSVRISPQLLDGQTEQLLWSDHYDREFNKQLELESELASAIVDGFCREVFTVDLPRSLRSRVRKSTGARKRVLERDPRRDLA